MPFSERMGLAGARDAIQLDTMDDRLRMALYNLLHKKFSAHWFEGGMRPGVSYKAAEAVWTDLWYRRCDTFEALPMSFLSELREQVLSGGWSGVYDLLEFLETRTTLDLGANAINRILEREASGYRLREGMIVPITDGVELAAIDDALNVQDPFKGARRHILDALDKLSQKPAPDLRNAITEAVSAVESAARVVSGSHKGTLADALKALEKTGHVHRALKEAWLKLYGYTSDEQGLRHAMTEDPDIDFATAKYMVVSCAAFVNLLSTVAGQPPRSPV